MKFPQISRGQQGAAETDSDLKQKDASGKTVSAPSVSDALGSEVTNINSGQSVRLP